jgi:hypothetical protein
MTMETAELRKVRGPGLPGASLLFAALIALMALQVGAAARAAEPPDSGIFGFVRAAGVCDAPIDPKCSVRAPTIEVRRVSEPALVAGVRPGPLGRFRVRLSPGLYELRLRSPAEPRSTIARKVVPVRVHEFTYVLLGRASRIR